MDAHLSQSGLLSENRAVLENTSDAIAADTVLSQSGGLSGNRTVLENVPDAMATDAALALKESGAHLWGYTAAVLATIGECFGDEGCA